MMFNLFHTKSLTPSPNFGQFVGFFTAHAIWQTEDGANVIPIVGFQDGDKRSLERIEAEDYALAAQKAVERLKSEAKAHDMSLCALDGYTELPTTGARIEAITIAANDTVTSAFVELKVPYRSTTSAEGAAVYEPILLSLDGADQQTFLADFWKGVDSHEKASAYWKQYRVSK